MPTTKKKKSGRTAARKTVATKTHKKASCRTCKSKGISSRERNHVCLVAALSITAGILLCADAAIMMFA